jgi:ABC-type multidrug transport system permease subunit
MKTKDVEHFFRCLLATRYSSVEKSLFSYVPQFLIGLFGSLLSNFLSSVYILDINPLLDVGLVNIFSQSVGCCFFLIDSFLCLTEVLQFYEVPFVNY